MQSIKEIFGKNVKKLRKAAGLTQEEMAEKIDVSQTFFANIERGHRGASFETVELIAKFFNIPYSKLFETEDEKNTDVDYCNSKTINNMHYYKNLETKLGKCLLEVVHNCLQEEDLSKQ